MKPFFIFSLPRSRTAWLANFLTYGETYCFHEGWIGVSTPDEMWRKMKATGRKFTGNSDSGNIMFLDEIMDEYPNAKLILIERPMNEVIRSLSDMGFPGQEEYLRRCHIDLQNLKINASPMVVPFHLMDNGACREMWEYVTDEPLDEQRLEMLEGINMEVFPDWLRNRVMRNTNQIENIVRYS